MAVVIALLYILAFIGAWSCLSIAALLALLGAAEWQRERRRRESL